MASEERKLSVIVFGDIVGYTSMMQHDEKSTLGLLEQFKAILQSKVVSMDGTIVQYFGDACLLSFDSPNKAVRCVVSLQYEFIKAKIPVRIGMHMGEVVFKEENAFGDTVNLASRIESISSPGAILLSKKIIDIIKPSEEIQFLSLGSFEFKNVKEPLEIFAISNSGLVVPERKYITGKLKEKKTSPWIIFLAILFLATIGYIIWPTLFAPQTIPVVQKEKKLAISVFENQTNNTEFDAFGTMVSDWVTNRLMETGEINIINFANVKSKIQNLDLESLPNPQLANSSGIELILKGRYYQLENSLFIIANLIDVKTGAVVKTFEKSNKGHMEFSRIIQELSQDIISYWAVKNAVRYVNDPPDYQAYKDFLNGVKFNISNPELSESYYKNAYTIDTGFYSPLFGLLGIYNGRGEDSLKMETLTYLNSKKHDLTEWEMLRLNEWNAIENLDWVKTAKFAERRFAMDSSDFSAINVATICYGRANQPFKAIDLVKKFDKRYLPETSEISWQYANQMFQNILAGNYEVVDSIALLYDQEKIPDALAAMHMMALIHLNDSQKIKDRFNYYLEEGMYDTSGKQIPNSLLGILMLNEMYLMDKQELLKEYAIKTKNLIDEQGEPLSNLSHLGFVSFYLQDYSSAQNYWEKEDVSFSHWPGWMRYLLSVEFPSRLGVLYAEKGQFEKAKEQLDLIEKINDKGDKRMSSAKQYYRSRILAYLGEKEEAILSLEQAFKNGFHFFGPERYGHDPFLKPLKNQVGFINLLKPK